MTPKSCGWRPHAATLRPWPNSFADRSSITATCPIPTPDLTDEVVQQVEIAIKYAGYISRQENEVAKFKNLEDKHIPPAFDYTSVPSLRNEARQKFITNPARHARPGFPHLRRFPGRHQHPHGLAQTGERGKALTISGRRSEGGAWSVGKERWRLDGGGPRLGPIKLVSLIYSEQQNLLFSIHRRGGESWTQIPA